MNPLGVLMARKRSVRDVRAVLRLCWSFTEYGLTRAILIN